MSYHEFVSIQLHCDRKGCFSGIRVEVATRDECNLRLFEAGWRLAHGKQICPAHVARYLRLRKSRGRCACEGSEIG